VGIVEELVEIWLNEVCDMLALKDAVPIEKSCPLEEEDFA